MFWLAFGLGAGLLSSWGQNSIFGGFYPSKAYYQTNFWEIENNNALKFADLVRQGKIAFLGTHDLIAHIAGADRAQWTLLKHSAEKTYQAISRYFSLGVTPSISALILPYTMGVVLDDLAQPPATALPLIWRFWKSFWTALKKMKSLRICEPC